MNHYTLQQLKVGQSESFCSTITEEKMRLFYEISGDNSPIHMDAGYAQKRGFTGRVCYGMLQASLFSTLAGVYLPGENCLLHSVDSKFLRPVFIGDDLTVTGTVQEIEEAFSQITVKAVITNQKGEKVCRAVIKAGVEEIKG